MIVPTFGSVGNFVLELAPLAPKVTQFKVILCFSGIGVSMENRAVTANDGGNNQHGIGVLVLGVAGVESVGNGGGHHGGCPFRLVMYIL